MPKNFISFLPNDSTHEKTYLFLKKRCKDVDLQTFSKLFLCVTVNGIKQVKQIISDITSGKEYSQSEIISALLVYYSDIHVSDLIQHHFLSYLLFTNPEMDKKQLNNSMDELDIAIFLYCLNRADTNLVKNYISVSFEDIFDDTNKIASNLKFSNSDDVDSLSFSSIIELRVLNTSIKLFCKDVEIVVSPVFDESDNDRESEFDHLKDMKSYLDNLKNGAKNEK